MIAIANPTRREMRAGSVIRLDDGTNVYPEDIRTAAHARAILDEVEATIASIEQQLADGLTRPDDSGWHGRAKHALVMKRRAQAILQNLLREFRRAERIDGRRVAFINAAEQMLEHELFVEIWQRASESDPVAFEGWKGAPA